jgi:hypothetical protein
VKSEASHALLGVLGGVSWGVVLHELELWMLNYVLMNYRQDVLRIALLVNRAPLLFPENAWSFLFTVKAAPEHPSTLFMVFL